jgi:putative ABC transport system permease protein
MNAVDWVAGDPKIAVPRLKQGDSVIVADRFLTTQKVKLGDKLKLGTGKVQGEFEIVGAVNSAGLDIATQSFGIRNQYMEYSVSSVFLDHSVLVNTFDNRDVIGLQLALDQSVSDEEILKRVAEVAPGVQFSSGRWILQTINEVMVAMLTVQSAVAFSALFLACLGAGNVILANIQGKRYEYGVLRAIGAHRRVLARLIFGEAIVLALVGALVGTLLGIHLAWVGAQHYRDLAGLPIRVNLPGWPITIGWLVLVIMTMNAALPAIISILRRQPSALLAIGRNG